MKTTSNCIKKKIRNMFFISSEALKKIEPKLSLVVDDDVLAMEGIFAIDVRPSPVMTLMAHYKSPPVGLKSISNI